MAATIQSPPQSPPDEDMTEAPFPYNEALTNAIMHTVLNPPSSPPGIFVMDFKDRSAPVEGESIRPADADPISVDLSELPLSIDDPRRKYRSPIPGINLTHPGGYFEGSGFSPPLQQGKTVPEEIEKFGHEFIKDNSVKNQSVLRRQIRVEIGRQCDALRKCMEDRQRAIEDNKRIDAEIQQNEEQRAMERRIEERMRDMSNKKQRLG